MNYLKVEMLETKTTINSDWVKKRMNNCK
jgi:hypothetical protein